MRREWTMARAPSLSADCFVTTESRTILPPTVECTRLCNRAGCWIAPSGFAFRPAGMPKMRSTHKCRRYPAVAEILEGVEIPEAVKTPTAR